MAPALRDVQPRIQSRFKDRCGHLTDSASVRLNDLPVQYGVGLFETGLGSLLTHCMIKGEFISGIQDDLPAFFHCHTDITIPYDELGELTAVRRDGSRIVIIRDGRFVLPGCEELNKAFEK